MSGSIVGGVVLTLVAAPVFGKATVPAARAAVLVGQQTSPAVVPASPGDPWDGRWSVSETTREGHQVLVRRNTTAASLAGDPGFPARVRVVVPLPRGADYTAASDLNGVETLLLDALERDRRAICVLVLTSDTTREFVFYAADAPRAASAVADLRPKAAPYELQTSTDSDAAWELYASFAP